MHHISLLLCAFVCTAFAARSNVVDLTSKNFDKEVLASEVPYMVEFYAPWCGHCQNLAPEWEKAATNLLGILPVGKVDCTQDQALCSKYGVKGYPSIKCFSEKGKKVQDYNQARTGPAVVKYATEQVPNHVVLVKDSDALTTFLSNTADVPHVLLFTSKNDVNPLMKALSTTFKNRVLIGQVHQGAEEVVKKYNIESFPTLIAVKGEDVTTFDGSITPDNVSGFVSGLVGEEQKSEKTSGASKPAAKPKTSSASKLVEITDETLESLCENQLCIVGFVGVNEGSLAEEEKSVLQEVVDGFKGDGKFVFGWVDRSKATNAVQKFSLSTSEPSLIVYNAKRSKYAKAESFDVKSARSLMERVIGGDVTYTKL